MLTVIPLFFLLTIIYIQQAKIIKDEAFEKLTAIRDLKVIELKNWIAERNSDLKNISTDKELTDLEFVINKNSLNKSDKQILKSSRDILNRYLENYPAYIELFIIEPLNAKILISTNKSMEGIDKTDDEYFKTNKLLPEVSIKDIYYSITLLENSMTFSIPIYCSQHSGEHIVGIIVARIDLKNSLYRMLANRVGLGETGETLIVNEDKLALNELRWHDDAPLKLSIIAKPAEEASSGKTGITKANDYRNKLVLAAYTFIPETKWGFVCKQDMSELNETSNQILIHFIVSFILTLVIAIFLAYALGKAISKPIVNLNRIAQKIKGGDLSARSISTSNDETKELSVVFNNMADAIEAKMIIQKQVTDISETMIKQTSLHEFSTALLKHLMKITGSKLSIFYILNEGNSEYEHFVSFGTNKKIIKGVNQNKPELEFNETLLENSISHLMNLSKETILKYKAISQNIEPKEIIVIPVMVDDLTIALIAFVNENKINAGSLEVVTQAWHSINVSYSNLLANERTRILSESLVRTNEQLEHQKEILQNQSDELVISSNELIELNKEMEAFSYSVSHDLRAPLRHIDGFSKLLYKKIKGKIDDNSKKHFDNIISASKQMTMLIDDLLVFSRMGRKEVKKTTVNMKIIVDEAMRTFASQIKKENVTILVDEMHDVDVDLALMAQVWINLISNAIKFTRDVEASEIHIGTEKDTDGNSIFFIKDNGAGFDQKYVDKIFGVFHRLHNTNEFEGTGIGLANVKRIILKHRGDVWAEGEVNKGASFFFKLSKG